MKRRTLLCFLTTAVVSLHLACGQEVIETIGFGQEADAVREGEAESIRIRLGPQPIAVDVSGQVVPLSISQYENYTFATQRTVPQSVQDAINAISDPAEYEAGISGRRDFNTTVFNFTITAGTEAFDIDISTLISEDEVNEAAEQFILVLEADSSEVVFDVQQGVLVVTILDNNPIFLNFNASTYTFNERDGTVANVRVQKNANSPDTEVDFPIQVLTLNGTATAGTGGDIEVESYNKNYIIHIDETEVELDAITIVDDAFPETDEGFTLSLMKGDGTDALNFFPAISVVTITIVDDDVVQVGFTQSIYSVTEGESSFVEVCITLTDGQSLSSSLGYGNFEVLINNTYSSATEGDYDATPSPNLLTIEGGQEIACTNITINDDIFVETLEVFGVSVVAINSTFSAGVTLTQDVASIEIIDDDANRCVTDPSICGNGGACQNNGNFYVCVCRNGFEGNATAIDGSLTCVDVNECANDPSICGDGGTCQNIDNGNFYSCDCSNGFEGNGANASDSSLTCVDTDECANDPTLCGVGGTCVNIGNGNFYRCDCSNGFEGNGASANDGSLTCVDANECANDPPICGVGGTCQNINNGNFYRCNCSNGFEGNGASASDGSLTCVDTNECADDSTPCGDDGSCVNIDNGNFYSCDCSNGFEGNGASASDGSLTCVDANECAANATLCGDGGTCVNMDNGNFYSCDCSNGFEGNGASASDGALTCVDTNECADDSTLCGDGDTCVNIDNGNFYSCDCSNGFEANGANASDGSLTCVDTNECADDSTVCGVGGTCVNIDNGNFYSCNCSSGFEGNGASSSDGSLTCVDINECAETSTLCGDGGTCVNIDNFYSCNCSNGFEGNGASASDGSLTCVDTNECADDSTLCGDGGTCVNIDNGNFYSCNCSNGFEGNGASASDGSLTCVDTNECANDPTLCGDGGICQNINNGNFYRCNCSNGFEGNGASASDGSLTCVDTNECANDPSICGDGGTCQNIDNGNFYRCNCSNGFEGNGASASDGSLTCVDTNECANNSTLCGVGGTCANIDNGNFYSCNCSNGFEGNGASASDGSLTCVDANECVDDPTPCGDGGTCQNIDNGNFYSCDCSNGFEGNGANASDGSLTCVDTNECADDPTLCGVGGTCVNIGNGNFYRCNCSNGFEGNGASASDGSLTCVGATVGFASSNYTGVEGEAVEVCVTIHSPNQTVLRMSDVEGEFSITGSNGSDTVVSVTLLVLNSSIAEQCFNLLLLSDGLVEGTEIVTLTLQLKNNIYGIEVIAPNTTVVTIIDEDFAVIGFMQSAYEVNEQSGQDAVIDVCVQLLNGTIAPGVSVNYTLDYDSGDTTQSFTINPTMGVLTARTTSVCHSVIVLENDVVEPDGTINLRIENSSLKPPNTVLNVSRTDITIINSDILMVSVELSTSTIMEGASTNLSVTYDGNLHQKSTVTVDIITTDGSANGSDYSLGIGSITLSTSNRRSEFTVLAIDDILLEDSQETFSISITLRNLEVMAATQRDRSEVMVTIVDNEELVFSFRESSYKISEDPGGSHSLFVHIENFDTVRIPMDVVVSLSALINFMTSNATQGTDYVITMNSQDFRYNTQSLDVVIDIKHDLLVEGNEVIYLSLTQPTIEGLNSNAAVLGEYPSTVVIILDDDEINIGFNASSHTGEEGDTIIVCVESSGGILAQGITLDYLISAPREDFALRIGSQADTADALCTLSVDGDYSLTSVRVTLSANITNRCIEIHLIDDTIVETDESFLVQVEQIISSDDVVSKLSTEFTEVTIINNDVFTGCPYGPDDVLGIIWPHTPEGFISSQPCPGGVDVVGAVTRMCYENGTWGKPNVLSCQSLELLRVSQEAEEVLPPADAVILEVTPEQLESVAFISKQLVMATDSEEALGLFPVDLNTTNNIVVQVLNVLESVVEDRIDDAANEELVEVFNNILNETNQVGWTELQTSASGSQTLLQNTERYGAYLAKAVNNTDESLLLVRENIVVKAEVVDTSSVSDVVFPTSADELDNFTVVEMDDSAQITIPAGAITRLSAGNSGANLAIVHIIFRNIGDFLPAITSVVRSAPLVISSQFGGPYQTNIPDDVFLENPITLNFSFTKNTDVVTNYAGVFWDFSDPVGSGGWSSEGVHVTSSVTRGSVTTVLCNSTHLTSFAVLVDEAGGLEEEQLALQVISYIGCIISTICLSITAVFYLAKGKELFSSKTLHYFVHLNLSLSLLLGYVVFMFGIELGTSSKGGCAFVAALLQYLFLSAFCWMMCEGVMLLYYLNVFSKLPNKWWFFMLLGYCIPLIFVVVGLAARADYYGVRGDDGELSFCWLSTEKGTIFAFVAPIIVIIIINVVFLVFALVALVRSKNSKAKTEIETDKAVDEAMTTTTLILLPLLGLTWLFGLLTLNHNATAFAWLFAIFNSLQGATIFFFHVVRNDKVWSKISTRLPCLKQCKTKTDTAKTLLPEGGVDMGGGNDPPSQSDAGNVESKT